MGRGVSIQTQTITKPSKAARGQLRRRWVSRRFGGGGCGLGVWGGWDPRAGAGAWRVVSPGRALVWPAGAEAARRDRVCVCVCVDADQGGPLV